MNLRPRCAEGHVHRDFNEAQGSGVGNGLFEAGMGNHGDPPVLTVPRDEQFVLLKMTTTVEGHYAALETRVMVSTDGSAGAV